MVYKAEIIKYLSTTLLFDKRPFGGTFSLNYLRLKNEKRFFHPPKNELIYHSSSSVDLDVFPSKPGRFILEIMRYTGLWPNRKIMRIAIGETLLFPVFLRKFLKWILRKKSINAGPSGSFLTQTQVKRHLQRSCCYLGEPSRKLERLRATK